MVECLVRGDPFAGGAQLVVGGHSAGFGAVVGCGGNVRTKSRLKGRLQAKLPAPQLGFAGAFHVKIVC
jgi:hypothetical protein